MSNILDDYKNSGEFTDHLFLQDHQVEAIVAKLKEEEIPHQIRPSKNLDDIGFVPLAAATKLSRADFIVQIPNNLHFQVDELIAAHPELLHVSADVRELFLASSLRQDGWFEILIYPEEWEEGDSEIASKLLAKEGIQLSPELLVEKKETIDYLRAKREKKGLSFVQILFITLTLIIFLGSLLSGFSFLGL
jgi:hypothetical protein